MTATTTRPTAADRRRAAPSGLWLIIRDRPYAVRRVACHRSVATEAYRLLSDRGDLYDVVRTPHGPACDCPDFVYRRDGLDPHGCKHVQALIGCGLIEPA